MNGGESVPPADFDVAASVCGELACASKYSSLLCCSPFTDRCDSPPYMRTSDTAEKPEKEVDDDTAFPFDTRTESSQSAPAADVSSAVDAARSHAASTQSDRTPGNPTGHATEAVVLHRGIYARRTKSMHVVSSEHRSNLVNRHLNRHPEHRMVSDDLSNRQGTAKEQSRLSQPSYLLPDRLDAAVVAAKKADYDDNDGDDDGSKLTFNELMMESALEPQKRTRVNVQIVSWAH